MKSSYLISGSAPNAVGVARHVASDAGADDARRRTRVDAVAILGALELAVGVRGLGVGVGVGWRGCVGRVRVGG